MVTSMLLAGRSEEEARELARREGEYTLSLVMTIATLWSIEAGFRSGMPSSSPHWRESATCGPPPWATPEPGAVH